MSNDNLLSELDYPTADQPTETLLKEGDARDLPLQSESVDLIFTSPPYWQKRDYGHEDQIGQESTPEKYVESLMFAFEEWERVLRETGSILINIGDKFVNRSRVGIPWKVAEAARRRGWKVRSEIIWFKPNGMPTPARDRLNTRHEYIFHLTRQNDCYFDKFGYEIVYDDPIDVWKVAHDRNENHLAPFPEELVERGLIAACPPTVCQSCGKPSERITEAVPTQLNTERPQARRAMVKFEESDLTEDHLRAIKATGIADAGKGRTVQNGSGLNSQKVIELADEAKQVLGGYFREFTFPQKTTIGWSKCDCDRRYTGPGTVLDPFAGSGTTLQVAKRLGFSGLGVDLSPPDQTQIMIN